MLAPVADELVRYIADQHLIASTVIGHSLGGELALMLAERSPTPVGRAMMVDALPYLPLMFSLEATPASIAPMAAAMPDKTAVQSSTEFAAAEPAAMARLS